MEGQVLCRLLPSRDAPWRYPLPRPFDSIGEVVEEGFPSIKIFTTEVRPPSAGDVPRMVRAGHLHDLMTPHRGTGRHVAGSCRGRRHGAAHAPEACPGGAHRVAQHAAGAQRRIGGHVVSEGAAPGRVDRRAGLLRACERPGGSRGHRRGAGRRPVRCTGRPSTTTAASARRTTTRSSG